MSEPSDWLGIDVGWVYPAVDSDGDIYRWSKAADRYRQRQDMTLAGTVKITRADGTTTTRDPYDAGQLADVHARADDHNKTIRVHHIAMSITGKARRTGRGIALEDWHEFAHRRTAWTHVYNAIVKQTAKQGLPLRTTDRAWTSLTCPECDFIDRINRPSRNHFRCGHCGHEGQADAIAAQNIRLRAVRTDRLHADRPAVCSNPACRNPDIFENGRCLRCYWYARRQGRFPTAERIETLELAESYREFCEQNKVPGWDERSAATRLHHGVDR